MLPQILIPVVEELRRSFNVGKPLIAKNAYLVFVFGARLGASPPKARELFMRYARGQIKWVEFFLAEEYFEVFSSGEEYDLLTTEERMVHYADCLLMFLESESTFAELGAFAIKDDVAKRLLLVNEKAHRHSDSFIAKGPVAKAERLSRFGAPIYVGLEHALLAVAELEGRLAKLKRQRAESFSIRTYEEFQNQSAKIRMLVIYQIVGILAPVRHGELIQTIKAIYGLSGGVHIETEVAMLQTLKLVSTCDGFLTIRPGRPEQFITFRGIDPQRLRASVIAKYHKADRERLSLLGNLRTEDSALAS